MATKNTNKTIFAIGIVAILGFLAYKLWPAIQKKLNSSSGGGSTGGGAGSAGGGNPYGQQPQSGQRPSISLGGSPNGSGNTSGIPGLAGFAAAQQWLDNFVAGSTFANSTPAQQEYIDSQYITPGSEEMLDNDVNFPNSIPTVPLQNYDVNQNAFSPGDDDSADASIYDDTIAAGGDGSGLGDYGFAYDTSGGGGGDQAFSDYDVSGDDGYGD